MNQNSSNRLSVFISKRDAHTEAWRQSMEYQKQASANGAKNSAKNAAAFFRKRFSFFVSASSSRKRRFSFMSSRSFWAVGFSEALFWHSSLNSLHHLQMLAFETPYSAVRLRYEDGQSVAWMLVHNVVVTEIEFPFSNRFSFRLSLLQF